MKSLLLFLSFHFLLTTTSLWAANFSVSNTANAGVGSLRAAIKAANADGNTPHTISFDQALNGQTITVSSMIFITSSMTIEGLGVDQLAISGGNSTRIFWIQNGTIEIKDLTLANGFARGGDGANGGMGAGGAIFMHEGSKNGPGSLNLTLTNVHFQNNRAMGGTGKGSFAEGGGGMGGNGGGVQCCGGGGGGVIGNGGDGGDGNGTVITGGGGGSVGNGSNLGPGGPGNDIFGNGGNGSNTGGQTGGFGGGGGGGDTGGGGNGGFGGGGGGGNFGGTGGFGGGGGTGGNGGFGGGGLLPGFGGGAGTSFFQEEGGGMGAGGAIFVTSGLLTLENVSFSNNTALGGAGGDGDDGLGLGGAIFVFDRNDNGGNPAPGTATNPVVTTTECQIPFTGNTAGNDASSAYFTDGVTQNNNDNIYGFLSCPMETTEVSLSNGDLLIEDINGGDSDDDLRLKKEGANLLICDPNQLLLAGTDATQINDNCVSVPLSDITGKILVNTLAGEDLLTLDFSMGDFIPAEGIEYIGGAPTSGPGDALAIEGANTTNAASNYLNESDGSIELDGSTITYTGLEPVSFMGSFVTFEYNFTVNSETITFEDAGGGSLFLDSDFAEATTFTPPTMSLGINGEGGTDILNIQNNLNLSHALSLDVEEVNLNGTAAGSLSATGLELSAGTSLNFDLNDAAAGTGYDQYVISGDINLNDAGLQINPTFLPTVGQAFVLIDNTGGTTTGTFAGLPEGSVALTAGAREYIISYANNDVTLTARVKVIPTMGQWAFFLFGLSIFTLAIVGLYNFRRQADRVRA